MISGYKRFVINSILQSNKLVIGIDYEAPYLSMTTKISEIIKTNRHVLNVFINPVKVNDIVIMYILEFDFVCDYSLSPFDKFRELIDSLEKYNFKWNRSNLSWTWQI